MERLEKLRKKLAEGGLDGILLIKDANLRYISGYTGSESYLVVSSAANAFITDSRYTEQAANECKGFEIVRWRAPFPRLPETIKDVCGKQGIHRLGFEREVVTYDMYETLKNALDGVELVPTTGIVESIRYVKDAGEIDCIRKAAQVADRAFENILGFIRPGVSEKDIERELHYAMKKNGADDIGFPIIVASGDRSSLPHAIPSDRIITKGDFITMDFGAMYHGYRSDMTRTIVVGAADEKQRLIYGIVKAAQEKGSQAIKAGVSGKAPDAAARGHIAAAGYGDYFGHGLGHGVGLEIHEQPFMSGTCDQVLEAGNVVTVEPGIYLPGWGGVRIEDSVLVTAGGIEVLTKSPKELITI